jgi:NADPH-dependent 2,4-dienoyl-CoA reductase/sulfur reductase-like enzyme
MEIQHQQLSDFDSSGRRRPIPIETSTFTLRIDALIQAIGQQPNPQCLEGTAVETRRNATVRVGQNQETSRPGVFAVGDAVTGPASVIEAVAQGNRVAEAVDHYVRTGIIQKVDIPLDTHLPALTWDMQAYGETARIQPDLLDISERRGNFSEVELSVKEEEIRKESKRCLRCDLEWHESRLRAGALKQPAKAA